MLISINCIGILFKTGNSSSDTDFYSFRCIPNALDFGPIELHSAPKSRPASKEPHGYKNLLI